MGIIPIRTSISGPIRLVANGINADGTPTINVGGNEVTLLAYWRVINLAESGAAVAQIIDKIMLATNSKAAARLSITHIVEAILENLLLVLASGADPGSPGLKRGSILANFQKPRPISISTYRASYAPQQDQLADSEAMLKAFQRQEDRLVSEALKLASQPESLRMRPESEEKRQ